MIHVYSIVDYFIEVSIWVIPFSILVFVNFWPRGKSQFVLYYALTLMGFGMSGGSPVHNMASYIGTLSFVFYLIENRIRPIAGIDAKTWFIVRGGIVMAAEFIELLVSVKYGFAQTHMSALIVSGLVFLQFAILGTRNIKWAWVTLAVALLLYDILQFALPGEEGLFWGYLDVSAIFLIATMFIYIAIFYHRNKNYSVMVYKD